MITPFDAAAKRREILSRLQEQSLGALRLLGAVPMTAGVTRPLASPEGGGDIVASLTTEVVKGAQSEGPRFLDRHSTDANSTYRNARYRYFTNNYGARDYAYDAASGRRVKDGDKPGRTNVGVNFDMDATDARSTWDEVFGSALSFDDVKAGKTPLSSDQIQALFDTVIQRSEAKLVTPGVLTENQRLALLDISAMAPDLSWAVDDYLKSGNPADFLIPVLQNGATNSPVAAKRYTQATTFTGSADAKVHLPDYKSYREGSDKTIAFLADEEGFAGTAYWDVNAWRIGYGSDTITKADGSVVRVTKGMTVTKDEAKLDLQRREPQFRSTAQNQFGASWTALKPNTQDVLTSVAYNYGSVPKSVVAAASKGDVAVADAIEALGNNPGINNPTRRKREKALILAGL